MIIMDDILPRCLLLIFYTVAGGFFSAGETALSYCNNVRILLMADNGDRQAKRVARLLDHFDETVVALLVGVNIIHVAAAASATVLFVSLMGDRGAVWSTVIMTVITFVLSETIPKSIANANPDAYILATAGVIQFFSDIFRPLVYVLTKTGEFLRDVLHVSEKEPSLTEDEFSTIVEGVQNDGLLEENESDIIQASIEFSDISAIHVMTPREKIVAIEVRATENQLRQMLMDNQFSRYPVYHRDLDHIVGTLVAGPILFKMAKGEHINIRKDMVRPLILPNTISASDAFQRMRQSKTHFAVIQDADRHTVGVITMDDVLEELVDDISEIIEPADPDEADELDVSAEVIDDDEDAAAEDHGDAADKEADAHA